MNRLIERSIRVHCVEYNQFTSFIHSCRQFHKLIKKQVIEKLWQSQTNEMAARVRRRHCSWYCNETIIDCPRRPVQWNRWLFDLKLNFTPSAATRANDELNNRVCDVLSMVVQGFITTSERALLQSMVRKNDIRVSTGVVRRSICCEWHFTHIATACANDELSKRLSC